VFERFTQPAHRVVELADEEAARLGHNYLGPEHVLLGILRDGNSRAARVLQAHGLGLDAARAAVGRLVEQGVLPRPERSDTELLRSLGIDLEAVRRRTEETFGRKAVDEATWQVLRRPWWRGGALGWTPLCGKPLAAKGALHLASVEADALGQHDVGPEHVLLGLLRDAAALPGDARPSRRAKRTRAYLGLPEQGASPVKLVVEARGLTLEQLREAVLAELHAAT
jgi:ATP-dependent Clp protease ATP-binding subunit ClpA